MFIIQGQRLALQQCWLAFRLLWGGLNTSSWEWESYPRNTVGMFLGSLYCKKVFLSDLETSLPAVSHKHSSLTSKMTQGFYTYHSTAQRLCQLQGKTPGFVQWHKLVAWSRAPGPISTWQKWQLGSGVHLQRGWWLVYFYGQNLGPRVVPRGTSFHTSATREKQAYTTIDTSETQTTWSHTYLIPVLRSKCRALQRSRRPGW